MDLTFFGLTSKTAPQYRMNTLTEVHDLVFHGNGGYIWSDVYNMPIYLRRFALSKIRDHFEAMNKTQDAKSPNSKTVVGSDGKVKAPQFTKPSTKYK